MFRPIRLLFGLVLLSALAMSLLTPVTSHADPKDSQKILLVLDASGSMNGKDPSGSTKIQAAQKALTAAVAGLPTTPRWGCGSTAPRIRAKTR